MFGDNRDRRVSNLYIISWLSYGILEEIHDQLRARSLNVWIVGL